jgi:hypothetical protein
MQVMLKLERSLKLDEVPSFLKHARSDPGAILNEHSPKTVHLTIALAIRLWGEHGQEATAAMREFRALPDPYKPGYRASAAFQFAEGEGPITDKVVHSIITVASTGGSGITRKK